MESARTYSFPIILLSLACLLAGLGLGLGMVKIISFYNNKKKVSYMGDYQNILRLKRMEAIKKALKESKDTYEFTTDFSPVLTKQ